MTKLNGRAGRLNSQKPVGSDWFGDLDNPKTSRPAMKRQLELLVPKSQCFT